MPSVALAAVDEGAARVVLQRECSGCHGRQLERSKRKGNKEMLLDGESSLAELEGVKVVVRGKPEASDLIASLTKTDPDERMPQPRDGKAAKPLPAQEIDVLRAWVRGDGGPALPAKSIKRIEAVRAIHQDLSAAQEGDHRYFRYLTLHNLWNGGFGAELPSHRAAVSKAINSLSSEAQIAVPRALGPESTVLRIDLRDYGGEESSWDMLAKVYPYDLTPNVLTKVERELRAYAHCSVPMIRADWFVFASLQTPFYHRLLNLPNTHDGLPTGDAALEDQLGIPVTENIRRGRAMRGAFTDSGVSGWNRLIERWGRRRHGEDWDSSAFGFV